MRRRSRLLPVWAAFSLLVAFQIVFPGSAHASPVDDTSAAARTKTSTPIKHFVTLMQENHSFDNYFGTYPGADGFPEGTHARQARSEGRPMRRAFQGDRPANRRLGPYGQHPQGAVRRRQDEWIHFSLCRATWCRRPCHGYYDDGDIPYYWNVADNYVLFDRAFTSAAGGSIWNHFYWVTGSPGNSKSDALLTKGFDHVPTIFDRLQAAGVDWKFYIQNYDPSVSFRNPGSGDKASQIVWAPVLNYNRFLDDPELRSRIVPMERTLRTCATTSFRQSVTLCPPAAVSTRQGIQAGSRFVRGLVNSLMASSAWDSSAFMWTYDDWGGWYDHVEPPSVDQYGYGFAPCPGQREEGEVNHTTIDFTSQLKFIENNWGVKPLAKRDRAANDISSAFDFAAPPREPIVLSEQRHLPKPSPPATWVVYTLYGAALAVPVLILGFRGVPRPRRGH